MKQTRILNGGLDMDSAPELIATGDYPKAVNMDLHRPNTGERGFPFNSDSFDKDVQTLTETGDLCIGGFEAHGNIKFAFFYNADATKNKILKFEGGVATRVVRTAVVEFSSTTRISSGAYIDDTLYYTDKETDIKAIDLSIDMVDPSNISVNDIALIKRPPSVPPNVERSVTGEGGDPVDSNLVTTKDFQGAFQYVYNNGQKSILSPFSALSNRDYDDEGNKAILFSLMVSNDPLPKSLDKVNLCIRENNIGVWRVVETRDVSDFSYNGNGDVEFWFYNAKRGTVLTERYSNAFELVPLKANTLELAMNRLWLAGITEGYNTPATMDTTIKVLVSNNNGTDNFEEKVPVKLQTVAFTNYYGNIVFSSAVAISGYYVNIDVNTPDIYFELIGYAPSPPVSPSATDTTVYATSATTKTTESPSYTNLTGIVQIDTSTVLHQFIRVDTGFVDNLDLAGRKTLIPDSSQQVGVVFSDFGGRKCGVYTDDSMVVNAPDAIEDYKANISWKLNNALNIPDWADTCSIVVTKNLNKSFYVESEASFVCYSSVDAEGEKTRTSTSDNANQFIEIDVTGMLKTGIGYDFKEGDRITVYDPNFNGSGLFDLEIVELDNTSIICPYQELQTTAISGFPTPIIQIYTPIVTDESQLFYEIGQTYKILRDGNGDPYYSVNAGIYEGDTILDKRVSYSTTAFDLATGIPTLGAITTDKIYRSASVLGEDDSYTWNTDIGRAFIVTEDGQSEKVNYGRYSGNHISDTQVNALNEFDPTGEVFLPIENGEITALKMTSKAQGEGGVLLAMGKYNTASIFIGEVPMSLQQDTSFMVQSSKVVGGVKSATDRFGTIHPDSVIEVDGEVFFYDYHNKAFIVHSGGKNRPISETKVRNHFRNMTDAISETDLVLSGYDHAHSRFYASFPTAGLSEYNTISYSVPDKRWISLHEFAPDLFIESPDKFSMVTGKEIYERDDTETSRYNGTATPLVIHVVFNEQADTSKWWRTLSIKLSENLLEWSGGDQQVLAAATVTVVVKNDYGQQSTIIASNFECAEYEAHGAIMCDESGGGDIIEGDFIVSPVMTAEITINHTAKSSIKIISSEYKPSLN